MAMIEFTAPDAPKLAGAANLRFYHALVEPREETLVFSLVEKSNVRFYVFRLSYLSYPTCAKLDTTPPTRYKFSKYAPPHANATSLPKKYSVNMFPEQMIERVVRKRRRQRGVPVPVRQRTSETKKCVLIVLKFSGSCHAKYTAVFAPISIRHHRGVPSALS